MSSDIILLVLAPVELESLREQSPVGRSSILEKDLEDIDVFSGSSKLVVPISVVLTPVLIIVRGLRWLYWQWRALWDATGNSSEINWIFLLFWKNRDVRDYVNSIKWKDWKPNIDHNLDNVQSIRTYTDLLLINLYGSFLGVGWPPILSPRTL